MAGATNIRMKCPTSFIEELHHQKFRPGIVGSRDEGEVRTTTEEGALAADCKVSRRSNDLYSGCGERSGSDDVREKTREFDGQGFLFFVLDFDTLGIYVKDTSSTRQGVL